MNDSEEVGDDFRVLEFFTKFPVSTAQIERVEGEPRPDVNDGQMMEQGTARDSRLAAVHILRANLGRVNLNVPRVKETADAEFRSRWADARETRKDQIRGASETEPFEGLEHQVVSFGELRGHVGTPQGS